MHAPASDEDEVCGTFWMCDPAGVHVSNCSDGGVAITAGFSSRPAFAERADGPLARWSPVVERVPRDAGLDAWRDHAREYRVGDLVVRPPWVEPVSDWPGCAVIIVDPGRAFGSGSHPTTRLALAMLQREGCASRRVADLGCGSGVLAIAAAVLGAAAVIAVDIAPEAIGATHANAARNGVAGRVRCLAARPHPIGDPALAASGPFDVVVANIGAAVLDQEAATIASLVTGGGALILTGILNERWAGVAPRYPAFHLEDRRTEDGWTAATLRRAA